MNRIIAVVVTYNRKALLEECIEALDNQSHRLMRIIILDNGSTDGTREWLRTIEDERHSIFMLESNIGGAGGFSRGIKEACKNSCDYVLVLDDDCILDANYVENLLGEGKKAGMDKLSAMCGTVYENGRIATNHRGYLVKRRLGKAFDYWKEFVVTKYQDSTLRCDIASFCGLMISREIIDLIGYPKEEYFIKCDDIEYSLRLCRYGTILNVNSARLNHKIKTNCSKNVFDWKYYYDIRNGIDMTKRNGLYLCTVKIIVKSLIFAIMNIKKNTKSVNIWARAVYDGVKGRLGKNEG